MNWLAMAVAAVSALLIGFVWYHPKVFGNAWMKSVGLTPADARKTSMVVMFGGTLVLAFIAAMPLAYSVSHADENLSPFVHGFYHGAMYSGLHLAVPVIGINALTSSATGRIFWSLPATGSSRLA